MAYWRLVLVATLMAGLWLLAPASATLEVCVDGQEHVCDDGFTVSPREVVAAIGEMVTVSCVYEGSETMAAIDWAKGGTAILDDDQVCNCSVDTDGNLILHSVAAGEEGLYECVRQVGFGQSRMCTSCLRLADAPAISSETGPTGEEDTRMMSALVVGDPTPGIKWLHNGKQLTAGDDIAFSRQEEGDGHRVSLTVSNLSPEDRGTYELVANNSAGTETHTWRIPVEFAELVSFGRQVNTTQYICTGQYYHDSENAVEVSLVGEDGQPLGGVSLTSTPNEDLQQTEFKMTWESSGSCSQNSNLGIISCKVQLGTASHILTARPCDEMCVLPQMSLRAVDCNTIEVTLTLKELIGSPMLTYSPSPDLPGVSSVTIPISQLQFNLSGLLKGTVYKVTFSCGSQQSSSKFISTLSAPSVIIGVKVVRMAQSNAIFFRLTWQASPDTTISGYRVNVTAKDTVYHNEVQGREKTQFDWTNVECGLELDYQFQVAAVSPCGTGRYSEPVRHSCSMAPPPVSVIFTDLEPSSTSLAIQFSLQPPDSIQQMTVVIKEKNDRFQTTMHLEYSVPQENFDQGGSSRLCVGGLSPKTQLQVCLQVTPKDTSLTISNCTQTSTLDQEGEGDSSCLTPTVSRVVGNEEDKSTVVPDWAIAAIVVGVLVIFAMVFCLLGICFACNTSHSKEVIYDERDNVAPPFHMHNPLPPTRAESPSRSCLKYHRERGHSTTWNDHVDTIRQMDTDNGTHV